MADTPLFGVSSLLAAIPQIPADAGRIAGPLSAIKQAIEVWQGARGDGLDRVVTVRDLLNSGTIEVPAAHQIFTFNNVPIPSSLPSVQQDPAMPPTPTNLKASGAMTTIVLDWDFPTSYTRLAYFEVWRSATNALGDAALIAQPNASVYTDAVGADKTYYYWVRAVSDAATSPYNAVAGTMGSTAIDVNAALTALMGEITESQLATDLAQRIDLIDGPDTMVGSVAARILAEANARIAAVQAETDARTQAILDEANARQAAITTEANTRQAADDSLSSQITTLTASVNDNAAAIQTEQTARADGDTANANDITALAARVTTNEGNIATNTAAITTEQTARADGDTALANQITDVSAVANSKNKVFVQPTAPDTGMSTNDLWLDSDDGYKAYRYDGTAWAAADDARISANAAAIVTEQLARASGDNAISQNVTDLTARVSNNESQIAQNTSAISAEQTARADGDSALSNQIISLSAIANAKVKTYYQSTPPDIASSTRGDLWIDTGDFNKLYRHDDSDIWSPVDDLRISQNAAAIQTEQTARADGDSALATQITDLTAVANSKSKVSVQATAPTSGMALGDLWLDSDDGFKAYSWDGTQWSPADDARIAANAAALITEQTARADGDSALSDQITQLTATVNGNTSAITNEQTARANGDSALSDQITQLSSTVNDNTAAIQTEATTRADETGYLGAQYTVRLDVGNAVAGFGISGTSASGAGATFDFIIRTDQFSILPPAGQGTQTPTDVFTYLANPTVVNGVVRPAGLYLTDLFVGNGVIDNAKIGDAAIDTAKISDLAVTTAKIGDAQITTAKIADLAVTTAKIANAAIQNAQIGDLQVTTAKIADAAITNAKISDLDAGKINAGTLDANRIGAGSITADKISTSSLSALSANMGVVTAGVIRNSTDSVNINMNATGSSLLMRVGAFTSYGAYAGSHFPVEIYADGHAFFGRDVVAGGTMKAYGNYTIPGAERPAVYWYTDTGGGGGSGP